MLQKLEKRLSRHLQKMFPGIRKEVRRKKSGDYMIEYLDTLMCVDCQHYGPSLIGFCPGKNLQGLPEILDQCIVLVDLAEQSNLR